MAFWRQFIPTKNERELRRLTSKLAQISALEPVLQRESDSDLRQRTGVLQQRFAQGYQNLGGRLDRDFGSVDGSVSEKRLERQRIDKVLDALLMEAFALVREASKRCLGLRHYDTQMLGGMVLHEGKISEMKTGEGKTLVATLPVFLNAITQFGVHVVTVNEYLASRDAAWMGQIYRFLGLEVGVIVHHKSDSERAMEYRKPITYGTNSEFGFDYLRDNMKLFLKDYVQRGLYFAIVDEVDSILIDEARTPLIISGPAEESTDKYVRINSIIPGLQRELHYTVDEKQRSVSLTEQGIMELEKRLKITNLYEPENMELLHHVNQGLRAHALYRRDVDYMVEQNRVKIIDEFTGRVLDGRRWSDGLHQAIEAKEGVNIEKENQTLATITYQNYFRSYLKLAGMTGTAETEAEEFAKIYDLEVVVVPTHKPMVREDLSDVVYKSEAEKFTAIVEEIVERQQTGQPILVGTVSVEKSEILSRRLNKHNIAHKVLNAKYHASEAEIIAQAGRKGTVTIATNMAGRGTDILLGGNPEFLTRRELTEKHGHLEQIETHPDYQATLLRYTAQCEAEKMEVIAAGGLHVLGTERHESRRIDNQLRGRSGRQGDPGSSRFYISLEDDLMRIFGGERIMMLMERLGMKDGEVIEHNMLNRTIENAQKRVEGHNFDIRKHLLEYDDVMNDQRNALYRLRRRVISADIATTKELLLDAVEDALVLTIDAAQNIEGRNQAISMQRLAEALQTMFDFTFNINALAAEENREMLEDSLYAQIEEQLHRREEKFGEAPFYHVIRIVYLQQIDYLWKEHLRSMDQLREGVSLRGYGQKDPKLEFKKEGYQLFKTMLQVLACQLAQKAFHLVITAESEQDYQNRLMAAQQMQARQNIDNAAVAGSLASPNAASLPEANKPVKSKETVGPNEACRCGSGKKYKKCCMLKHEQSA